MPLEERQRLIKIMTIIMVTLYKLAALENILQFQRRYFGINDGYAKRFTEGQFDKSSCLIRHYDLDILLRVTDFSSLVCGYW